LHQLCQLPEQDHQVIWSSDALQLVPHHGNCPGSCVCVAEVALQAAVRLWHQPGWRSSQGTTAESEQHGSQEKFSFPR
jgi:hypothetical protein